MSETNSHGGERTRTTQERDTGATAPPISPPVLEKLSRKGTQARMREAFEQIQAAKAERSEDQDGLESFRRDAEAGEVSDGELTAADAARGAAEAAQEAETAAAGGEGTAEGGEAASEAPAASMTMKEAAEALGLTPAELYNSIEVPISDDLAVPITELQDSYRDKVSAERAIAEKRADLDRREAGLATDIQALGVLDAMRQVPEGIRAQAVQHLGEMNRRGYDDFLRLFPDMAEPGNMVAFENKVGELLEEYGLSVHHMPVRPVGVYRLFQDVLRLRAEVKALRAPKPKTPPKAISRDKGDTAKPASVDTSKLRGSARDRFAELSRQLKR